MEAATSQPPRSRNAKPPKPEPETPSELIRAAAEGDELSDGAAQDAMELFLGAEEVEVEPTPLKLNLGTKQTPKYVEWHIVPIEDREITRIRNQARTQGTRAQRRRGEAEVDESLVARRIVAKATVKPDLAVLGKRIHMADPSDVIYAYFKKFGKTGLITQISGEVLSISGWDDDDIQEMEVEAAQG